MDLYFLLMLFKTYLFGEQSHFFSALFAVHLVWIADGAELL